MNAASGVVSFPADKLTLTSISKSGSIINFWVKEPSFSNSSGTVNFEGAALSPGFTGPRGQLVALHFLVKGAGRASLGFPSGAVLANDGQGTNILADSQGADFSLVEAKVAAPPVPVIPPVPAAPPELPTATAPAPVPVSPVVWPDIAITGSLIDFLYLVMIITSWMMMVAMIAWFAGYEFGQKKKR
jgi:hypothetical protein